ARCGEDAGLTMTGDLVGTLRYMAPEQAMGQRVIVDHRADIYSLGATLYELITLRPAFGDADRATLLTKIVQHDPPRLRHVDRRVPADLETVVGKAMEKSREDRYQTAQEFADDLAAFVAGRSIRAKPPTMWSRAMKWSRRHQGVVLAAVASLLVSCIALAWAEAMTRRANGELADAVQRAQGYATLASESADQASDLLYAADIRIAGEALVQGRAAEASQRLSRHVPSENGVDRRDFTWRYLNRQLDRTDLEIVGYGAAFDVEYSPDGTLLAVCYETGQVDLRDAATGDLVVACSGHQAAAHRIDFSADGELLAGACEEEGAVIWKVANGKLRWSSGSLASSVDAIAFHPKENLLAVGGDLGVAIYDPTDRGGAERTPRHRCEDLPGSVESLHFTADGRHVLVGGELPHVVERYGYVAAIDVLKGVSKLEREFDFMVTSVACGEATNLFAAGTQAGEVFAWTAGSNEVSLHDRLHTSNVYDLQFGDEDRRLFSASKDGTVREWRMDVGACTRVVQGSGSRVYGLAIAPGGAMLATTNADGSVKTWRPRADRFRRRTLAKNACVGGFSTDGGHVVTFCDSGRVQIVDMASGLSHGLDVPKRQLAVAPHGLHTERCVLAGPTESELFSTIAPEDYSHCFEFDLNGDGRRDRVASIGRYGDVIWQQGSEDGQFAAPCICRISTRADKYALIRDYAEPRISSATASHFVALDLNDELRLDPHLSQLYPDNNEVYSGKLRNTQSLAAADLDGDGDDDVVVASSDAPALTWLERADAPDGAGVRFTERRNIEEVLPGALEVVAGDITGDGRADVLVALQGSGVVHVYENQGEGAFHLSSTVDTGDERDKAIDLVDVDGDGRTDIVVATEEQAVWFRSFGKSDFAAAVVIDDLKS
ncbi:MAG: VCBS repeat-containing protein, partial [Planctomycetales bacterium]|nr:VCBS repeat-containing protein [Planctomycetales bacterium]